MSQAVNKNVKLSKRNDKIYDLIKYFEVAVEIPQPRPLKQSCDH
jgi:hypothetical protein